ncbi:MAG TPA: peptidylprolyl isomerase [Gemmatimonadales bacterium]|nr:peptidylprolyl isomerase [Gemmatimonadales bacterium]
MLGVLLLHGLAGVPAGAQEQAAVEQLAQVLAAEDARDFRPELFRAALLAPDSLVRRVGAFGAGRIGDPRATPLLLPLLMDPDTTVRVAAAFALGLLRDSAAVAPLIDRLTGLPALDPVSAAEAVTALATIGGSRTGEFFSAVLGGTRVLSQDDPAPAMARMVGDAWRLGTDAPVTGLLPFMEDTSPAVRQRAVYSLGRLRAPAAANRMLLVLRDASPYLRSLAARALTRSYAEAGGIAPGTVAALLVHAVDDEAPQVRINALRSLSEYRDSTLAGRITSLLDDPVANAQVQAAETLGELGGHEAVEALLRAVAGKGTFALRRTALVGLARADAAAFGRAAPAWRGSSDWRQRAAAAEGSAIAGPGATPVFLADRDGRVIAAGLQAWAGEVKGANPALLAAARPLLAHRDAGVRSVAADVVARAADVADLPALARMYAGTGRDSFPDAALSALGAILAIRRSGPAARARVDAEFLVRAPRPGDYLIRRWAEDHWPEAAARWGPAYPVATGRSLEDYRDVVRRYLTAPDSVARPHVIIDTEGRGQLEIELLGPDAPLTVDNFLRLVERRFFDGNRWHRVVPNFVVQDGDPRGDGFGGPGGAIRDEINLNRYDDPMLGMALSGPDTGMSQWFINLSPQPHLDGTYTVFGKVVGGTGALVRITQGDVIRTIARQ